MVSRTLITTADERTWPKDKKEPVLFLGEWCKRYSRKDIWENMDYKVVPYHWDDRNKLYLDYQYLQKLYKKSIIDVSERLNRVHEVNHGARYWTVLLGPWIGYFSHILYDRWFMLRKALDEYDSLKCYYIAREEGALISNDMNQSTKLFNEDNWNELIYSQLLKTYWSDQIELIEIVPEVSLQSIESHNKKGIKEIIKEKIIGNLMNFFNKISSKNTDYFFLSSHLPLKTELKLQLKLGQFPKIWRSKSLQALNYNPKMRLLFSKDSQNYNNQEFDKVVDKFISLHLPKAYIDGYKDLVNEVQKLPWPSYPKVVFTSNAYSINDIFKCWAAEKVEKKIPLVIGQHGGHFGMNLYSFHEEHQIEIADLWLSWGWSDIYREQIHPLGNIKLMGGKGVNYNPEGGALMVECGFPRYSNHLYSTPVASQFLNYLEDQKKFLKLLPMGLRNKVTLRLFPRNYGWDEKLRWEDNMPEIDVDLGVKNICKLLNKSRLYISTYNATTYLESFTWNIPTIIFWNSKHWELNEQAKPYFELLKSVGIFHETPQSAAEHMIKIWNDVDSWWLSDLVQNAKNVFCVQYARNQENSLNLLQNILKETKSI